MTKQLVVVPCDHRLMDGEKCPGHLIEVEIRGSAILSPTMIEKEGYFYQVHDATDA